MGLFEELEESKKQYLKAIEENDYTKSDEDTLQAAMHCSAKYNTIKKIVDLPNFKENYDKSNDILTQACSFCSLETVELLLPYFPIDQDYLALYMAARYGRLEITEFLLKQGADPNKKIDGITPLMRSVMKDQTESIKLLLKYGARYELTFEDIDDLIKLMRANLHSVSFFDPIIDKPSNLFITRIYFEFNESLVDTYNAGIFEAFNTVYKPYANSNCPYNTPWLYCHSYLVFKEIQRRRKLLERCIGKWSYHTKIAKPGSNDFFPV